MWIHITVLNVNITAFSSLRIFLFFYCLFHGISPVYTTFGYRRNIDTIRIYRIPFIQRWFNDTPFVVSTSYHSLNTTKSTVQVSNDRKKRNRVSRSAVVCKDLLSNTRDNSSGHRASWKLRYENHSFLVISRAPHKFQLSSCTKYENRSWIVYSRSRLLQTNLSRRILSSFITLLSPLSSFLSIPCSPDRYLPLPPSFSMYFTKQTQDRK